MKEDRIFMVSVLLICAATVVVCFIAPALTQSIAPLSKGIMKAADKLYRRVIERRELKLKGGE